MKVCVACTREKPIEDFINNPFFPHRNLFCRACRKGGPKETAKPTEPVVPRVRVPKSVCKRCGLEKPHLEFALLVETGLRKETCRMCDKVPVSLPPKESIGILTIRRCNDCKKLQDKKDLIRDTDFGKGDYYCKSCALNYGLE